MSEEVEILRSRPARGKQKAKLAASESAAGSVETKADVDARRRQSFERQESRAEALVSGNGIGKVRKFVEEVLSKRRRELPSEIAVEELIDRERELCREAVELLAAGKSAEAVAACTGIAVENVRTLSEFVPDYGVIVRSTTVKNLRAANLRMSEIMAQQADKISADKLAFSMAITAEKSELLSGGLTQRVEHRRVVTREELQALFESLPRAKAKVIEEAK